MEYFYFLFNPSSETYASWYQGGYARGFIVLFGISLLITVFYYLLLGKINGRNSKINRWFLYMLVNCILIFLCTMAFTKQIIPIDEEHTILKISQDVWFFSLLNGTFYAILLYFIFSLLLNNFSLFSRFIPFNLFKKS